MSRESDNFEWFDATEAESLLRRKIVERKETPDVIDLTVIGWPGSAEDHELLMGRASEPKRYVSRYIEDARQHLDKLWVVGGSNLTDEDIRQLGPFLIRDDSYREDAVFQILSKRRSDVPPYMRRFVTVKKDHLLQYGLGSQAGRISLEGIQRANTVAAKSLIEPLIEKDEFEDLFMASDMLRHVLRSIYYVLNEPTESSALLMDRFKRQVEEEGSLSAEELIARTYNFTYSQHEKHLRANSNTLETEETLINLLEEGRLERLKNLGNTVLVAGLGIVTAQEYKNGE